MKISIIMPVCACPDPRDFSGRAHHHLASALDSIVNAGYANVELLIGSDGPLPNVKQAIDDWSAGRKGEHPPLRYVEFPFSGKWGNPQRNALLQLASGDYVCFQDQDDEFFPNALADVQSACTAHPGRPLLFRMAAYHAMGKPLAEPWVIWQQAGRLEKGWVGGHMIVLPNDRNMLANWREDVYEGDWHFISDTLQRYAAAGIAPCWRGEFISITRPWSRLR